MRAVKERWSLNNRVWDRGDEGRPRKFILGGGMGWINYLDARGVMQPCDPTFSEPDGTGALFTKMPRVVRFAYDGTKRVYLVPGNDNVWIQVYKPSDLTGLGTPTSKVGGDWVWDRDNFTFTLHVRPSRVKFSLHVASRLGIFSSNVRFSTRVSLILNRSLGIKTLHLPFESRGLTRQGFDLLAGGRVVARLRKPFVRDALGEERDLEATITDGEIELALDDTGLTYPLLIDPPLDLNVAATLDDAQESDVQGSGFSTGSTNDRADSNTGVGYSRYNSGIRFTGVTIAQGSTIDVAYIGVYMASGDGYDDANSDIYCEDVDDAADFATTANVTGRTRTTASAAWVGDNLAPSAAYVNSPSIIGPVQEVVSRVGWASGNALMVLVDGRSDVNKIFYWRDYTGDSVHPSTIHLEWTETGGAGASGGHHTGSALLLEEA